MHRRDPTSEQTYTAARALIESAASSRWSFEFWWIAPDIEQLDGCSPAEFVEAGGNPERVLAAAARWVEARRLPA